MSELKAGDKVKIYCATFATQGNVCEGEIKSFASSNMVYVEFKMNGNCGYSDARWFHVKQLELIERPKPKVKLYLWAIRHSSDWGWSHTTNYYKDEEHLKSKTEAYQYIRLDDSMIEVDDE